MQLRFLRAAIEGLNPDADVFFGCLRILDDHIEVAVVVENAGVEKLELRPATRSPPVLLHKPSVRKFPLRILVQHLHVAVCGRAVQVEVILFDILAMIAFAAVQAEEPFFKDWVAAVPQCQAEDHQLITVANAADRVFSPTVCLTAGQVVGEVIPGGSVLAVIFPNGAPGAIANVGTPLAPRPDKLVRIGPREPFVLLRHFLPAGKLGGSFVTV